MQKTIHILLSAISMLMLAALACSVGQPSGSGAAEPSAVPPSVAPPADTPTPPYTGPMPAALPLARADQAGDIDSSPNANKKAVAGGDVFVQNLYERPFNANTMDTYFPYLDITEAQGFKDDVWGYATIRLANVDPNGALPGQYAVELDLDKDGRGDWLILASHPTGTDWSRQGVQAWMDADGKVGGVAILTADNHTGGGNGYEQLVFDQGQTGPAAGAWARIRPDAANVVELAFSLEMLGSPRAYAMGAWAGTLIDPARFDYHDFMTHIQAGSPNPGYEVYPLKDMAEIDNTCRLAISFAPTGKEPGLCANVQQTEAEGCKHGEICYNFGSQTLCVCRP